MKVDKYGQQIYDDIDLCSLYLTDPDRILKNVLVENLIEFDPNLDLENMPTLIKYAVNDESVENFDARCKENWFIPDEYKNFDIASFVLTQCKTDEELQRAGQELLLYQTRDMFMLLRYLKYLVDTMRSNNIVWGVGRGSSVSSFVLFLIGVHKINPIYYGLSVEEFLR